MGRFIMVSALALIAIGTGLLMVPGADSVSAEESTPSMSWRTLYDESTSVFCATREKAVSCVYVPRDTVRNEGSK